MADDQNAPVAAGGDSAPALSVDDAVATLNQEDEKRQNVDADVPVQTEAKAEAEPADKPAPEAESSDDEAPATEEDAEPDAEEEAEDFVHGNARMRLRDGSVVAVAEGKKALERLKEIEGQRPQIEAERAEIEKAKAEVQQQREYLERALPLSLHLVQKAVPPAPPEEMWDSDPIQAIQLQRQHDAAKAQLDEVQYHQRVQAAEQQKAQQAEFQKFIETERARLLDVRPELKDPEKAKAFHADFMRVGKKYGFTEDEINNVHDHRLIVALVASDEKASKWDKLQDPAVKQKVAERAKEAIPVQQPGRRVQPAERRGAQVEESWKQLSKSGSIDDAVAFLNTAGIT